MPFEIPLRPEILKIDYEMQVLDYLDTYVYLLSNSLNFLGELQQSRAKLCTLIRET